MLENADRKYRYHNKSLEAMSDEVAYRESAFKQSGILFDGDESDFIDSIKNPKLRKSVKRLTEKQRKVIELYFWLGYKQNEIAEILNIEQSAVSRLILRAIENLKKNMA